MKAFGWRVGGRGHVGPLIFVLVLSAVWQTQAKAHRSDPELQPGNEVLFDPILADEDTDHPDHHINTNRQILAPDDRLGYCDESTVSRLTPYHFQILESGLHVYRCWSPRVGRLMSLLRQEQNGGGGGGGGREGRSRSSGQRLSANEGYRLRCRILFKFDTCRSNFAKYYSPDNPEISTEWPEEILKAINSEEP